MIKSSRRAPRVNGAGGSAPILSHPLEEETSFEPNDLVRAVRRTRGVEQGAVPALCVLDFDGDLTDKLVERDRVRPCPNWPCFHSRMWLWPTEQTLCGIVPRTIGGPYAVLVAEQLAVCGARVVVGLASAGRVSPELPLPAVVVADEAIRDEGTSYHYLPPAQTVAASGVVASALEDTLPEAGLPVRRGLVWTTDAPYRETRSQISRHAARGAWAVEMQAASLFAFGRHHHFPVGLVAHVTNAADQDGEPFDKGPPDADISILRAICAAVDGGLAEGEDNSPSATARR